MELLDHDSAPPQEAAEQIEAAIRSMKKEDADTIERVIAALSRTRSLANEVGKHLAADTSSF
jgi:hypothetical protein